MWVQYRVNQNIGVPQNTINFGAATIINTQKIYKNSQFFFDLGLYVAKNNTKFHNKKISLYLNQTN